MNTLTINSMNTLATDTIELRLDGAPHRVSAGTTLAELMAELHHQPRDVSTAVNGSFVPRGEREAYTLNAGDAVLVFQPIVAG